MVPGRWLGPWVMCRALEAAAAAAQVRRAEGRLGHRAAQCVLHSVSLLGWRLHVTSSPTHHAPTLSPLQTHHDLGVTVAVLADAGGGAPLLVASRFESAFAGSRSKEAGLGESPPQQNGPAAAAGTWEAAGAAGDAATAAADAQPELVPVDSCTLAVEAPSPAAALAASTGHLSLNGSGTTGSKGLILLVPLTLGIGKVRSVRGRLHAQHSAASAGQRTRGQTAVGAGQPLQLWLGLPAALPQPPHPCPHPLLQLNPRYAPQLEVVLTWPQSIGIVGGRPSSSLYFVGCQVDATAGAADTAAGAAPATAGKSSPAGTAAGAAAAPAGHHQAAAAGDLKAHVGSSSSSSGGTVDAAAGVAASSSSGGSSGSVIYLDPHQVQEVSSPLTSGGLWVGSLPARLLTHGPAGSKSCCALNAWSSHPFAQAASCILLLRFCSQLVAYSAQAGYNAWPCYISRRRPPAATRTGCHSVARPHAPCQPPPSTLPWRWASTAAAWVRQCCAQLGVPMSWLLLRCAQLLDGTMLLASNSVLRSQQYLLSHADEYRDLCGRLAALERQSGGAPLVCVTTAEAAAAAAAYDSLRASGEQDTLHACRQRGCTLAAASVGQGSHAQAFLRAKPPCPVADLHPRCAAHSCSIFPAEWEPDEMSSGELSDAEPASDEEQEEDEAEDAAAAAEDEAAAAEAVAAAQAEAAARQRQLEEEPELLVAPLAAAASLTAEGTASAAVAAAAGSPCSRPGVHSPQRQQQQAAAAASSPRQPSLTPRHSRGWELL